VPGTDRRARCTVYEYSTSVGLRNAGRYVRPRVYVCPYTSTAGALPSGYSVCINAQRYGPSGWLSSTPSRSKRVEAGLPHLAPSRGSWDLGEELVSTGEASNSSTVVITQRDGGRGSLLTCYPPSLITSRSLMRVNPATSLVPRRLRA
jgi:hypothetical protein